VSLRPGSRLRVTSPRLRPVEVVVGPEA
jgi:hypothetical protein